MAARPRKVNLDRGISAAKQARMSEEGPMSEDRVKPADCRTMAEVRFGIDRLDEAIVALIGERFRYMDSAARIKPERGLVRDEGRKAQVLANVSAAAGRCGVPAEVAADLYERLIEASIAYELNRFDQMRAGESPREGTLARPT
jgi:isochorismate pyruvate lyase